MNLAALHAWNLTPPQAIALQRELAQRIDVTPRLPLDAVRYVAGADISYDRFSNWLYAAVIVLRFPELTIVEIAEAQGEVPFPYVPGLLSFREAPPLLQAFARLTTVPDVVMIDGQGIAHPRRFGIACHLGLWLQLPCLGCAKSRLIGTFAEVGETRGSWVPLMHGAAEIGAVVRTKARTRPVYVSPGHRLDLASAVTLTLATHGGYRIPEPTRLAHGRVNQIRRENRKSTT